MCGLFWETKLFLIHSLRQNSSRQGQVLAIIVLYSITLILPVSVNLGAHFEKFPFLNMWLKQP